MNVDFIYTEIETIIRTEKGIWGSTKKRTMQRKMFGYEKSDIPASLRISKYLWIRTDKVYRDLSKTLCRKSSGRYLLIVWKSRREWGQFVIQINMYSFKFCWCVSLLFFEMTPSCSLLLFPSYIWDLTGV